MPIHGPEHGAQHGPGCRGGNGRLLVIAVLAWFAASASACAPTSLYRSAEPLPRGEWHLTAAAAGGGSSDRLQDSQGPIGHAELGVRRGLATHLDVGARAFVPGVEVNATWRLLARDGWSVALVPQLSLARTPASTTTTSAAY